MFFLINFGCLLAASFAFIIAILTPNWLTFTKSDSNGTATTVQRGIFFLCNLLPSNITYQTTQCVSIIQQGSSSTESNKWTYEYAIACASLAIICATFSFIALWLSGIYFQVRRRTEKTLCFLLSMCFLLLIIFGGSCAVWILLICETLTLGISINPDLFNWPMWLAVSATGGYLMAFITMLFSFCLMCRRENKMGNNFYHSRNQF